MEKPISDKIQAKLLELRLNYPTPSPEKEERQLRDGYMREATDVGAPQGGPASPLLANILLDDLDKELERRGLPFVRYADDFAVFAKSLKAA